MEYLESVLDEIDRHNRYHLIVVRSELLLHLFQGSSSLLHLLCALFLSSTIHLNGMPGFTVSQIAHVLPRYSNFAKIDTKRHAGNFAPLIQRKNTVHVIYAPRMLEFEVNRTLRDRMNKLSEAEHTCRGRSGCLQKICAR